MDLHSHPGKITYACANGHFWMIDGKTGEVQDPGDNLRFNFEKKE